MPFIDSLDVANRALQHLGATRIQNPSEDSVNNAEISFVYDKVRRAELRRNTWRFSTKQAILYPIDTTTFLLSPEQWNAGMQYLPGSIVADANGQLWVSSSANNINNNPATSDAWDSYYGQMTVDVFGAQATTTNGGNAYWAGDLVYMTNPDSSYVIYMSLQNNNTETPNVADVWSATESYMQDQCVSYSGSQWRSLIALNLNNIPAAGPANWSATTTYTATQLVTGSDGFQYSSVGSGNIGNNPVTDGGTNWTDLDTPTAWTAIPIIPASSSLWVPVYAALTSFNFVYPLGAGPLSDETSRNVFRLPAGFLRQAPSDPKAGLQSIFGGPAWNGTNDWEFQGDYIISECGTPLMLRFVADVQTVSEMDDMFCEGLAARIAVEACETITNSNTKQQTCNNAYQKFMSEARIVNAIETGPVTPPEDDYIMCRI